MAAFVSPIFNNPFGLSMLSFTSKPVVKPSTSSSSSATSSFTSPSTSSSSSCSARVKEVAIKTMPTSSTPASTKVASTATFTHEPRTPMRRLAPRIIEPSRSSASTSSSSSSAPDLTKLNAESLECWKLANHCLDNDLFLEALRFLDVILQQAPHFLPALEMRLYIHHEKLQLNLNALFDTTRILAISPQHLDALKRRLVILFELKSYDEASVIAESILKLQPHHVTVSRYLDLIDREKAKQFKPRLKSLFDARSYAEAKKMATFILSNNPNDRYTKKYLGAIHVRQGENETAIKLLKEAHLAHPTDRFTLFHLALAYHQLAPSSGEILSYQVLALSYLKLIPLDTEILLLRARIYIKSLDMETAHKTLAMIPLMARDSEYALLLALATPRTLPSTSFSSRIK